MKKHNSTLLYLLTLSILSTGCSTKKCAGPNAHKGLYNALTCNYEESIQELQVDLNSKTIKRNRLFHNYQRLIATTTNKQNKINKLEEEISLIDQDITSFETLFNSVKDSKNSALSILRLKAKLKKLNMDILNKSTFFDIEDALFTNKKLLVNSDKQRYAEAYNNNSLSDKKYAQAYNQDLLKDKNYAMAYHQNLLEDKKYAQAYNNNLLKDKTFVQAYKKDIEKDRAIRLSLSSKIKTIKESLSSENISSSEQMINSLIENIKKYNNSLKRS